MDDDISVRESLDNLFRSVGTRVETYGDAHEFLSVGLAHAPSCLVLDISLPGLSGFEVRRILCEGGAKIPVVFITAHSDNAAAARAAKGDFVETLTKPFADQDLLDAVQRAIAHDRAGREEHRVG